MKDLTLVLCLGGGILLALASLVGVPLLVMLTSVQGVARPPLVRDLPVDFREGEAAFKKRVAEAFPPGSSEAALFQRLNDEGFRELPSHSPETNLGERQASLALNSSACVLTWRVRWQAEANRLASASGEYGGNCL